MSNNMPNEVVAIAMALSLYFSDSIHDNESNVLTIKRYNSPWSDKIYQVTFFLVEYHLLICCLAFLTGVNLNQFNGLAQLIAHPLTLSCRCEVDVAGAAENRY